MGKKGYNWKARTVSQVEIDDSATKQIRIDIDHRPDHYDSSNALVLPSKKRKTKRKEQKVTVTRLLSKKRRKQLEKVVQKKEKKLQRATLLEELAKVQAPQEELKQYVSLTTIQTKGLKRYFRETEAPVIDNDDHEDALTDDNSAEAVVNAIKGSKKRRLAILHSNKAENITSDPNVIGYDESESESESNSNDDGENAEPVDDTAPIANSNKSEEETINEEAVKHEKESPADNNAKESNATNTKENEEALGDKARLENEKCEKKVTERDRKPACFVTLNRKPEIQTARLKLPVVAEEQVIVETINENPVVIITGETGSGKTTQVPQFLYEAGYTRDKMIGITEPRRVAAMSMSKRVAEEMNLSEKEVSYLIRFEGNATPETKIKFMTDGVLLKEIQSDFLLTKYSVIILDEAHERSVYTDILIGLLSRIVPLRNKKNDPLKLIIMSATLRVDEFVENRRLFKTKPPVLLIESRQFPVTIHFNKRTSTDYVADALRKVIRIHTRLPQGGILVFLTGQQEVNSVVRKLRKAFPIKKKANSTLHPPKTSERKNKGTEEGETNEEDKVNDQNEDSENDDFDAIEAIKHDKHRQKKKQLQLPTINLDDYSAVPTDDTHEDLVDGEDEDEEDDDDIIYDDVDKNTLRDAQPLWVLPLYSLLPSYKQARVFEKPPEDSRLCVVSTNVAETSLTISNVKYVIDCGRCKTRLYDKVTGVSTYRICYTSKASANQRAGRAGRTGPGHCYRLYSSAVFNDQFEQYSISEIQRKPIDDLLLQMKMMNIDKVINFPFPSPPDTVQLKTAENRLLLLGALQEPKPDKKDRYSTKVTPLGRSIAAFPVAPRYGKMLTLSHQHNLLKYTITMVAALSVQEVFIEAIGAEGPCKTKWLQTRRLWAGINNSLLLGDPMVLIRGIGAAEYAGSQGKIINFCEENGLRHKAVVEIRKLRQQLTNEINLNIPSINLTIDPNMAPPTDAESKLLRQIVLAGMVDRVAKKVSSDEIEDQDKTKWKYAYRTVEMEDPVYMHSSCVLRKSKPEWVVYQEVYETNKIYMRGVTVIEPEWLPKFASGLCQLSEPLNDPPPWYDAENGKVMCRVNGTFGRSGWELPPMDIEYPLTTDGVRWFARFFLDGQVCPKLKQYVPSLLSTPSTITKSWAKLIPRTEALAAQLLSEGIISKDKLLEVWSTEKSFLLESYKKWLPESAHGEITLLWPPI